MQREALWSNADPKGQPPTGGCQALQTIFAPRGGKEWRLTSRFGQQGPGPLLAVLYPRGKEAKGPWPCQAGGLLLDHILELWTPTFPP